jgi:tetratricopeptide (TPR) repeat protein
MNKVVITFFCFITVGCLNQKERASLDDIGPKLYYYLEKGDTTTAIKLLEDFMQENPNNNEIKGALIVLRMQSGRVSKEESLNRLHELYLEDSTNKWLNELNSMRIIEQGANEEGLTEIKKMINRNPRNFWNYVEKGRKLIDLKKYDEAISAFNMAIELEPTNRWAYAERALAKYMKGDKQGACEDWRTPGGGSISYYEKYCK